MPEKMTEPESAPANAVPTRAGTAAAGSFVLDPADLGRLDADLRRLGWLAHETLVHAERIGGGNMNMTVRVRTDRRSFILKQARPWVVKYPHIAAPVERAAVEAAFYRFAAAMPLVAAAMPELLGFDPDSSLLCLEDMGDGGDLMSAYRSGRVHAWQCAQLTEFLACLHAAAVPASAPALFRNRAMRELNHEHQYILPLRPVSAVDLDKITPGLAALAAELKADGQYCRGIAELGQLYLSDGDVLVHGDFFPGSWLVTDRGMAVIDPEFCHLGIREYDLGVFLAHLELARLQRLWEVAADRYGGRVDWSLARRFAGAEIMRRLIGVAQLPLSASLATKRQWLKLSRQWVCGA